MRRLLPILLVLACQQATVVPSPTIEPTGSPGPAASPSPPAPTPSPEPYQGALVYGEFLGGAGPIAVRAITVSGARRDLALIPVDHDGRFAISPEGRRLAIYQKVDMHRERTARWWVRVIDLADLRERQLVAPRVDSYEERPWDIGWAPGGALLLASRPRLERIEDDGRRVEVFRFPAGTLGVTFRDPDHPGMVVAQTGTSNFVYLVSDDGTSVRLVDEREFAGITFYARRPGTDDVVELVNRFDGAVTLSVIGRGGEDTYVLEGPRQEGLVQLVGTTPQAFYLVWPVAQSDPAAFGVRATAYFFRGAYDPELRVVDATRGWGEFAPLGVSPDGRVLLVAVGSPPSPYGPFAIHMCCDERPAPQLLPPGDYFAIGWLSAP